MSEPQNWSDPDSDPLGDLRRTAERYKAGLNAKPLEFGPGTFETYEKTIAEMREARRKFLEAPESHPEPNEVDVRWVNGDDADRCDYCGRRLKGARFLTASWDINNSSGLPPGDTYQIKLAHYKHQFCSSDHAMQWRLMESLKRIDGETTWEYRLMKYRQAALRRFYFVRDLIERLWRT